MTSCSCVSCFRSAGVLYTKGVFIKYLSEFTGIWKIDLIYPIFYPSVKIPLRPTFYSYFKESFSSEYIYIYIHIYIDIYNNFLCFYDKIS